jgi:hypothetical protein
MINTGGRRVRQLPALYAIGLVLMIAGCAKGEAAVEKAVLFSAVEGEVQKGGQPLAGATLIREWVFAQDRVRGSDEAITDAEGHFAFPQVSHAYRKPWLFAQTMFIEQAIRVKSGPTEWRVWSGSKGDIKAGTEAWAEPWAQTVPDGPLRVIIDLDAPLAKRGNVVGHTLFTNRL